MIEAVIDDMATLKELKKQKYPPEKIEALRARIIETDSIIATRIAKSVQEASQILQDYIAEDFIKSENWHKARKSLEECTRWMIWRPELFLLDYENDEACNG